MKISFNEIKSKSDTIGQKKKNQEIETHSNKI